MGLTKEEKKALKLAKKLEKAKKDAEVQKNRRREELDREIAAYEMQRLELDGRLRRLMVKVKEPEFKQKILIMCHVFDRTLDKKDSLIDTIINLRRIANDQYHKTIANFCETVDKVIGKFLADLDAMCKDCEAKIQTILQNGEEDKNHIIEYQKKAESHMNILLYHSHELADTLAWTIRGENFVKIDEDTNKYLAIRVDLRSFLEGMYSALWEEFKKTLKGYISGTAQNQKQVRVLRKKEMMMADIIASQARKINNDASIVKRLEIELLGYESGTKQASFRDRRNRYKVACIQLKQYFNDGMQLDESQMSKLVMTSNGTVEYLENACKKLEKIQRLANLCRKLETLQEKVLPFGSKMSRNLQNDESLGIRPSRKNLSEDSLVLNAVSTTCGLTRLWQRISKAELTKKALYREKMLLLRENFEMVQFLKKRDDDRLTAQALKCQCSGDNLGKHKNQPHAVDGTLEARKIMNYY